VAAANVEYEVRILAANAEGFGEFSNSITFCTNEDGKIFTDIQIIIYTYIFCGLFAHTVPSAPRSLTVVASSSTSLQVTWEQPLCEYGILVNYTVSKVHACNIIDLYMYMYASL
jgi:hypothetical protein